MSILRRNGARLFETGQDLLSNTVFCCTFQPRKPWNLGGGANGGFLSEESGNGFGLSAAFGTNHLIGPGPTPGSFAARMDGATIFSRAYNATLYVTGDATMEAYLKCDDIAWPALADVFGFAGANSEIEAENYNLIMGVDSANRNPKYYHEGTAGQDVGFTWSDVSLPTNEWVYVAMVRDTTAMTVTLYINGAPDPTVYDYTGLSNPVGGANTTFGVGGNIEFNVNHFQGWLAGVRIRSEAATAEDIEATWKRINPSDPDNVRDADPLPEISPTAHANITLYHEAPQHDADDGIVVQTPTVLAGANGFSQAIAAERPIIVTAGGAPGWRMYDDDPTVVGRHFDGLSESSYITIGTPTQYHAFCVFTMFGAEQDNANLWTNHRIFGSDAGWWGLYARWLGGLEYQVYGYHWDGSAKITPITISRHEPHLAEMWFDGGFTHLRIDDGPVVSTAAGNITSSAVMEIGGNSTDVFQGVVHAVMFANDYSLSQAAGIRDYFANRYRVRV